MKGRRDPTFEPPDSVWRRPIASFYSRTDAWTFFTQKELPGLRLDEMDICGRIVYAISQFDPERYAVWHRAG